MPTAFDPLFHSRWPRGPVRRGGPVEPAGVRGRGDPPQRGDMARKKAAKPSKKKAGRKPVGTKPRRKKGKRAPMTSASAPAAVVKRGRKKKATGQEELHFDETAVAAPSTEAPRAKPASPARPPVRRDGNGGDEVSSAGRRRHEARLRPARPRPAPSGHRRLHGQEPARDLGERVLLQEPPSAREQMAILGEELAHGDLALRLGHGGRGGRGAPAPFFSRGGSRRGAVGGGGLWLRLRGGGSRGGLRGARGRLVFGAASTAPDAAASEKQQLAVLFFFRELRRAVAGAFALFMGALFPFFAAVFATFFFAAFFPARLLGAVFLWAILSPGRRINTDSNPPFRPAAGGPGSDRSPHRRQNGRGSKAVGILRISRLSRVGWAGRRVRRRSECIGGHEALSTPQRIRP